MIGLDRISLIIFSKKTTDFSWNRFYLCWPYLISNFMLILENLVGKIYVLKPQCFEIKFFGSSL